MSAFTPGPWEVGSREVTAIVREDGLVLYRGQPTFTEADARLIAAAPDLLEALKEIVMECIDEEHSQGGDPADGCRHRGMAIRCGICMSLDNAGAAIKKAEGA